MTTATTPSVHHDLRASPLGRDLSAGQLDMLATLVRLESYPARQVVAREGTVDDRLLAVVDGALEAVKHLGTVDETVLATLHAGDLAHELGFVDGTPRFASLVATSPARVIVLERAALESLIETEPRILYAIMRAIVRTVHQVQTRLSVQAAELTNYVVKQHGRY
jgi:CRP/FNR family cyclic AMP-dependent transcriptional regulator